jgi:hypothetical protein
MMRLFNLGSVEMTMKMIKIIVWSIEVKRLVKTIFADKSPRLDKIGGRR